MNRESNNRSEGQVVGSAPSHYATGNINNSGALRDRVSCFDQVTIHLHTNYSYYFNRMKMIVQKVVVFSNSRKME